MDGVRRQWEPEMCIEEEREVKGKKRNLMMIMMTMMIISGTRPCLPFEKEKGKSGMCTT